MSQNSSQVKLTGWAQIFFDYFFGNQGSDDEKVRQNITMMAHGSKDLEKPKNRIGKKYFWSPKFWPKNCPGVSRLIFFRDLLRQGNTKRKIDGSLKQTEYEKNSDWWWIYGGRIWQRWWFMDTDRWWYMDTDWWWHMDTDSERWRISNSGRWQGDDDGAAAAWQLMTRTRNSKRLDSKTSNLTRRCNRKFNKAKTLKRLCKGSDWFGYDELTLNFFVAFSWTVGMKNRLDLIYEKL